MADGKYEYQRPIELKVVSKAPKTLGTIQSTPLHNYYVVKPAEEPFTVNPLLDPQSSATLALQHMY